MIKFRQETKVDTPDIEALLDVAFGNHRYSRIAYKFRSGVRAIPDYDKNSYSVTVEFYVVNTPTELVDLTIFLERLR